MSVRSSTWTTVVAIGLHLGIAVASLPPTTTTYFLEGPVGSHAGTAFSPAVDRAADPVKQVVIWCDDGIRGFQFTWFGGTNEEFAGEPIGPPRGHRVEVNLDWDDAILEISGIMRNGVIHALRVDTVNLKRNLADGTIFVSNPKSWITPGWDGNQPDFRFQAMQETSTRYPYSEIYGFHGGFDPTDGRIVSLGACRRPTPKYSQGSPTHRRGAIGPFVSGPAGLLVGLPLSPIGFSPGATSLKTLSVWSTAEKGLQGIGIVFHNNEIQMFGRAEGERSSVDLLPDWGIGELHGQMRNGRIHALRFILYSMNRGRHTPDGTTETFETTTWVDAAPHFSFGTLGHALSASLSEITGFSGWQDEEGIRALGVTRSPAPAFTSRPGPSPPRNLRIVQ